MTLHVFNSSLARLLRSAIFRRMTEHRGDRPDRLDVHIHFPERVDVHVHVAGLAELAQLFVTGFKDLKQEIHTMGTTVSQQIDDAAARDEVATAKLSADLAAIAEELKANAPNPGAVVTQAQADRHSAIAAALEAAAAAADALVVTPPATP